MILQAIVFTIFIRTKSIVDFIHCSPPNYKLLLETSVSKINYIVNYMGTSPNLQDRYKFGNIIGKSPAMQEIYEIILKAAVTDANVIVYGESGTGKEMVAGALSSVRSPNY